MEAEHTPEWYRNAYNDLVKVNVQQNNTIAELKASLETAERLALQGGAGHQAIVDKAVSLKTINKVLLKACKFTKERIEQGTQKMGLPVLRAAITLAEAE